MSVWTNPTGKIKCSVGDILNFTYQGKIVEITLFPGEYIFKCWGASSYRSLGGGAYTSGVLSFKDYRDFFIVVGGQGKSASTAAESAGYNGGGKGKTGQQNSTFIGGGGASDIRLVTGSSWDNIASLRSRIMVAAGAAGCHDNTWGGAGGTLTGIAGSETPQWTGYGGTGGTQTSAGSEMSAGSRNPSGWNAGGFGYGGTNTTSRGSGEGVFGGAGGGAGWYGGGPSFRGHAGGGGGSSFISGHSGCNAVNSSGTHLGIPYFDSNYIFKETQMIAGNISQPQPDGTSTKGHIGNGHIQIECRKLFRRTLLLDGEEVKFFKDNQWISL